MNKNGFANIILVIIIVILVGLVVYFALVRKPGIPFSEFNEIRLSNNQRDIVDNNGRILLSIIDNDEIYNFFKSKTSICDGGYNINIPGHREFCEDKKIFNIKTRFTTITLSPDKTKIGFAITSDVLTPDSAAGIFYPFRDTNKIHFITGYYLGNEFISFSPDGTNFVCRGGCWEGMCGLFIKNSETLIDKIVFNDPEFVDSRTEDAEFVRWITDNEVEYKLGEELKRASF